jgi:hypothetical protein
VGLPAGSPTRSIGYLIARFTLTQLLQLEAVLHFAVLHLTPVLPQAPFLMQFALTAMPCAANIVTTKAPTNNNKDTFFI